VSGKPRPRLLDQVREAIRLRHYSYRTEQQYLAWIRRYIHFHRRRHPRDMGGAEVEAFLTYLANDRNVTAATQAQALAALLFLYKRVLNVELPWLDSVVRASRPKRLPVVLSRAEVRRVIAALDGQYSLTASLMYGSGLRLMETLRLRHKDVELERSVVLVRDGKGAKDRVTVLPESPPRPRRERSAARENRGSRSRHRQACLLPHLPTLFRDSSHRGRRRHPHGSGAHGPRQREDHADLHSRLESRRHRRTQPSGLTFSARAETSVCRARRTAAI
jgi:integrase